MANKEEELLSNWLNHQFADRGLLRSYTTSHGCVLCSRDPIYWNWNTSGKFKNRYTIGEMLINANKNKTFRIKFSNTMRYIDRIEQFVTKLDKTKKGRPFQPLTDQDNYHGHYGIGAHCQCIIPKKSYYLLSLIEMHFGIRNQNSTAFLLNTVCHNALLNHFFRKKIILFPNGVEFLPFQTEIYNAKDSKTIRSLRGKFDIILPSSHSMEIKTVSLFHTRPGERKRLTGNICLSKTTYDKMRYSTDLLDEMWVCVIPTDSPNCPIILKEFRQHNHMFTEEQLDIMLLFSAYYLMDESKHKRIKMEEYDENGKKQIYYIFCNIENSAYSHQAIKFICRRKERTFNEILGDIKKFRVTNLRSYLNLPNGLY